MKNVNAILFFGVILFCIASQYIFDVSYLNKFSKPWHMQPFANEDSLSEFVRQNYKILDRKQVCSRYADSSKTIVNILVDAWGLPMEDSLAKQDFSLFENNPHMYAVHHRQRNYTTHVEKIELKNKEEQSVFLFGGDSAEYGRKQYLPALGFSTMQFCQDCSGLTMIMKVDSILSVEDSLQKPRLLALTIQSSREGDRNEIHLSLKRIANLARKHPEVQFVIQGTHRPILGTPETRKKYYAHWVPVVVLNRMDGK